MAMTSEEATAFMVRSQQENYAFQVSMTESNRTISTTNALYQAQRDLDNGSALAMQKVTSSSKETARGV